MERISIKFSFCGRLLPIIGELTQLLRYRNISHMRPVLLIIHNVSNKLPMFSIYN